MKRILLLTENLGSGGAERQLVGLAALLKVQCYDVTVVTYFENQFREPYLHEHGVHYELHTELLPRATRIPRLVRLFRSLNPDVVITFLPEANEMACAARLLYPCRLIVSERSHTTGFNLRQRLRFTTYRMADVVVTNSVSEADNLGQHFHWMQRKLKTIPNFVETEKYVPLSKSPNTPLRILGVGRLIALKNILRLLDAIKLLVDKGLTFQFIWVGRQYEDAYTEQVKAKVQALSLEKVFLLKGQTNDTVSEYQQADIFCLPSVIEGYPNVLVEAMSCGLPVVCSRIFDHPLIVTEGKGGFLFDPTDINEMAQTLEQMLCLSTKERAVMGRYNRRSVEQCNSQQCFTTAYMNIIETPHK